MADLLTDRSVASGGSSADELPTSDLRLAEGLAFEPLERWAHETPLKTALVAAEIQLTYRELESRTNQIARALQILGAAPGQRIAFVLPRGHDAVLLLIAILKTGAAYVPLDAASPPTRIRDCIEDANPALAVVSAKTHSGVADWTCPVLVIDELMARAQTMPDTALGVRPLGSDLAYIIFTSGSTGRPKGVAISHESLSNFVNGAQLAYIHLQAEDRMLQAYSPASDGHLEEVWPTLLVGATLVVATNKEVHSGADLGAFMRRHQVTITSCAVTLLSMVDEDVPTLQKILFGAEHVPEKIVERWWRPGRVLVNTYGPTETTCGSTYGYCEPGKPITIGKPLPNYFAYVLDEDRNEVGTLAEGELAIAGICVSQGYFGREDLTSQRFVPNPFADPSLRNEVMYLTGDRVMRNAEGDLVWLGRIDAQVKIRGHRIELSEIETRLRNEPSVSATVAMARNTEGGEAQLVALVSLHGGATFDMAGFLERAREHLPAHMLPQRIEIVERIPVLPSGKVDRHAANQLHGHVVRIEREIVPPRSEMETTLLRLWQELFQTQDISCTDDFFLDLGGYSLLASRFVSKLRSELGFASVSVLDIYERTTIRGFAAFLESEVQTQVTPPKFEPVPKARYRFAVAWQTLGLVLLLGIQGILGLGPIVAAIYFSNEGYSEFSSVLLAIATHALSIPFLLSLSIGLKWVVAGKFKEGAYPVWSSTFVRWWFVQRLLRQAPVGFLTGTPFANVYLRLLGAKVGTNVIFESLEVDCPDLLSIGNDCNFENSSWLHAAEVANGYLYLRKINIADGCTVGVRSGVSGGGALEVGASLRDMTWVGNGVTVPAGEEWHGSPAQKAEEAKIPPYDPARQPRGGALYKVGAAQALLVALLQLLDFIPFVVVATTLYNLCTTPWEYAAAEPLFALALICLSCLQAWAIKWLVLGRLKPGVYPYPGWLWLRKWFSDKHLDFMIGTIVPLYDSLFARPWCRSLGMKVGPRCEIALPRRLPYDLVSMGEESFLASEVSVGMPVRRNGEIRLEKTAVGNRVFLGNDSVLPQGTHIPNDFLLGVLSVGPSNEQIGDAEGQAWLGSPAFRMPARAVANQFDIRQTYKPTRKLYAERLLHEAIRLVVPSFFTLVVFAINIESLVWIWNETDLSIALLALPLVELLGALAAAFLCKISKHVLIGRYEPTVQPLWSRFVYKAETYSAILHDFGVPAFAQGLEGTPYMCWLMRFLGAKVGKRAFVHTTDWTETDLIHIGEDTAINANAPLQAHLFEDRVMKVGAIRIGNRCSVGHYSVVLCDSELKDDAQVGHLSLVMKGETIPSNSTWAGSPVQVLLQRSEGASA